jgi:hypothetical protein
VLRYSILILLAACDGGVINPAGGGGKDTDTGIAEDPNLTLSVTEVDFGDIEYGKTYQQFVSVTNRGAAELVVSTITAETPFQVNPLSVTIQPGSTTQLTVSVNATTYEEFSSNVIFASNDPDGDVALPVHGATITDADGDGHSLAAAGGDDCDDGDRLVFPGAPEVWYDGIDENCDGLSDYDQDGDGWESDAYNPDASQGGGDCQDSNTAYFPGADDVPYDTRDTNCDGADDYDFDGDGSRSSDYGKGLDCNDNDPNVNISAD